jgi:hypothetical protein
MQRCQVVFFSYQKSQFGYIFEGLGIEMLVYFLDNVLVPWYILWPSWLFGIFSPVLVYCTKNIWQPWANVVNQSKKVVLKRNFILTNLQCFNL